MSSVGGPLSRSRPFSLRRVIVRLLKPVFSLNAVGGLEIRRVGSNRDFQHLSIIPEEVSWLGAVPRRQVSRDGGDGDVEDGIVVSGRRRDEGGSSGPQALLTLSRACATTSRTISMSTCNGPGLTSPSMHASAMCMPFQQIHQVDLQSTPPPPPDLPIIHHPLQRSLHDMTLLAHFGSISRAV